MNTTTMLQRTASLILMQQLTLALGNGTIPVIPHMCESKVPKPVINTALLNIEIDIPNAIQPLVLYLQSEQCYKCDLIPWSRITNNCSVRIDSRWPMRVELRRELRSSSIVYLSESCRESALTMLYKEGANYTIYLDSDNDNVTCNLVMNNDSADPFIPIYVAITVGILLALLWTCGKYLYRSGYIHRVVCFWSTESMMSDLGTPTNISQVDNAASPERRTVVKERLKSLDTFRGIAITIMIFVNYGGGQYWFFKHSKWNGLTVADLVFPWFVFIMGTAIVFAFKGQLQSLVPRWKIFLKILKRSAILFLLGLLMNSFGVKSGLDFDTFRIPGVLQRFAGTYLITASIHLFLAPAQPNQVSYMHFLTFFGYLGPGGLEHGGIYSNCTGGASGYIDRMIFGSSHIYQTPTSAEIYQSTVPYDPEGLLGTLTSCVLCFLGLQTGLGILLCEGSLNDGWIPINKNLWSLSFIFVLSGMAFFLLMVCYLLIDVYKVWNGTPFYFAGMNSIALYCGHEFFSGRAPVYFKVPETHAALLALNIWGTAFWLLVSIYFYYKKIFISV
ncbi:unnamed protein product [Candidula unifasciata]|uniref:DUF5009 domain-containing protein n=1 Tax=Candidula unifasciata TaxID=100452 RepID=A0A8S3ZG45_9EUPU|nr:unnamed protein product [Candidula unifasciata]